MKKIFFDFDRTLFNTDQFIELEKKAFEKLGVKESLWESTYPTVEQGYTLRRHFDEITKHHEEKIEFEDVEAALDESFCSPTEYVYPDVSSAIKRAKECGYQILLLSFGDSSWQDYKVDKSNLKSFFDDIHYTSRFGTKGLLLERVLDDTEEDVIFADDSLPELDSVHARCLEVRTYHVLRDTNRSIDDSSSAHAVCRSLDEIKFR